MFTLRSSRYDDGLYRPDPRRSRRRIQYLILIFLALAAVAFAGILAAGFFDRRDVTVVVEGKDRVCDSGSNGDCKYLVFTDHGTFQLTDSVTSMRFNTSDVYGRVKTCHRYTMTVYGWRFGLMSLYPTIDDLTDQGRVEGCEA
jgi:hypothetical protein